MISPLSARSPPDKLSKRFADQFPRIMHHPSLPRIPSLSTIALLTGVLTVIGTRAPAQRESGGVTVTVRQGDRPLAEAVVRSGRVRTRTDAAGLAILRLPIGLQQLIVASIGFSPETLQVLVRPQIDTTITVGQTCGYRSGGSGCTKATGV